MQIDSTRLHEALNEIAIKCHNLEFDAVSCVTAIRRALCDIEADTASKNAIKKYAGALEGLKDR